MLRKVCLSLLPVCLIFSSIQPALSLEFGMDSGAKIEPVNLVTPVINQTNNFESAPDSLIPNNLQAALPEIPILPHFASEISDLPTTDLETPKQSIELEKNKEKSLFAKRVGVVSKAIKNLRRKIFPKNQGNDDSQKNGILDRLFDSSQKHKTGYSIQMPSSAASPKVFNVPEFSHLNRKLNSKDKETLRKAGRELEWRVASLKLDEQEEFIQLLSQALGNNNFQVRYSAIVALLGLIDVASPDHQAETVGLLQKAISDRGWYQRLRIANDLPRLAQILAPQYHAEFMEILRKMVQDQDNSVRHCALHSLPKALQVLGTRDQIEIISLLSAALNDSAIDSRDFAKGKNIAAKILSEWTPTLESLPVEDLESFYQLSGNSETAGRIFGSIIRKKRLEKALTQGKAELSAPEENGVSARKQYGDLLGYSAQSTTHSLMLNNASGSSVAASPRSPALSLPASVVSGGHVFLRRFYWAFKALNGKLDAALGDYKNHPTNRKAEKILTLSEKKISAQGPTVSFLPLVAQTLGPNYSTEIWRIIKTTLENPRWPSEWRVVRELPALAQILGSNYYSEVMRLVTTHEATKSEVWVEIFLPLAQMLGPSYHVEIMNSLINLMRRSSPDVRNKATGNLPQLATILGPSYYAGFMEIIRERLKDPEWLARKYMAETLVKMTPVLGSSYHAEIMQLIQEILIDDDYIIRRDLARLLPKIRCIFKELPIEDLEVIAKNPRLHEIAKNFFDVMVFEKQFEKNILKTLTEGKPELPVDEERLGAESAQKRYGGILD